MSKFVFNSQMKQKSDNQLSLSGTHQTFNVHNHKIVGSHNQIRGNNNSIVGSHNIVFGDDNLINGDHNTTKGYNNCAMGSHNTCIEYQTNTSPGEIPIANGGLGINTGCIGNNNNVIISNADGNQYFDFAEQFNTNREFTNLRNAFIVNGIAINSENTSQVKSPMKPSPVAKEEPPAEDQDFKCGICFDRTKSSVMDPCMHAFCLSCAEKCFSLKPECPMCKQHVNKVRKLY